MDLSYTAADLAFRDKVRSFLTANLPADLQKKVRNHLRLTRRDYVRWHQIVARQGWAALPNAMITGATMLTPNGRICGVPARPHSSSQM